MAFDHYKQVIPTGFYSLAFLHEIDGAPDYQICTWGWGGDAYVFNNADFTALTDAWIDEILTPLASTNTALHSMVARDKDGVIIEVSSTFTGTQVGPFSPVNVAATVEKRTGVGGRAHRGRVFLPFVPDSEVSERGILSGSFRSGVVTDMTAFMTAANAIDAAADLVVLHSKGWDGAVEPPDPGNAPDPDVITHFTVSQIIGTQKRRLR